MCDHKSDNANHLRHGAALEHGEAHQIDHQQWSRRSFLRNLGMVGSGSMMLANMPLTALGASPLSLALANSETDRILVLIRLKGGNDGLNMIVPIGNYGLYQSGRPTIAIPENQLTNLDDAFAIPETLNPLLPLWEDGAMKVVHSVGYPDQNLSHFRSSDIWASASDAQVFDNSGWLGRWLEKEFPDFLLHPPADPPAIQIGGAGNLAFTNSEMVNMGVVVNNPDQLAQIAENGALYDPLDVPECYFGEQLSFVRTVANSTFQYAQVIHEAYEQSQNSVPYSNNLGRQFALIARLIKGGLNTRLYMVTLDGFDTHAGQNNAHPRLMGYLSQAVADFFADLRNAALEDNVLCMTNSEFGRRIEQNASGGTDHGAASPMLLFGTGLNGNSLIGQGPDLTDLDPVGNLPYETDFRSVYSTVLENWLCIDPTTVDQVMGRSFNRLPELGLTCATTPVRQQRTATPLQHKILQQGDQVTIQYYLPTGSRVRAQLLDMSGRLLQDLSPGATAPGWHELRINLREYRLAGAIYLLRMQAGQRVLTRKLGFFDQ